MGPFTSLPGAITRRIACGILGAAYATQGNVSGAEQMFRRALAIAETVHGPQSSLTAKEVHGWPAPEPLRHGLSTGSYRK